MRDDLRDFGRLHAAVDGAIEIEGQLDALVARNERGDRDDAAIPRIKARTFPHLPEEAFLRELIECRRDGLDRGPGQCGLRLSHGAVLVCLYG